MLLHFHTNQLDFNMLDFSLICFHHKYWFPPLAMRVLSACECVRVLEWSMLLWVCTRDCESVLFCPSLLHVSSTVFLSKDARICVPVCLCRCACLYKAPPPPPILSQGQNELMLNIPYWFYCNSFLIHSLFNFISLRLVGMEMRSVLFSSFFSV